MPTYLQFIAFFTNYKNRIYFNIIHKLFIEFICFYICDFIYFTESETFFRK